MGERVNERMSAAERASEASSAEKANELAVRVNERVDSEWPSALCVDFIVILPTVQSWRINVDLP